MFIVDADDELIGRQVMKLMNAVYQSTGKWFIYSNFIMPIKGVNNLGYSKAINPEILASNTYRIVSNQQWVTGHLRTYLRELYIKIPMDYFMESEGNFYFETSDRFEMYDLIELAGS